MVDVEITCPEHLQLIQEVNALRSTIRKKEKEHDASLIIIGYLERRLDFMMEERYA